MQSTDETFDFPKAELHCHLDGCFRLETIVDIAKKRKIALPTYDLKVLENEYCVRHRCSGLDEYLQKMAVFTKIFAGDLDSIDRITREAIEDKAREHVRYLELRFCPHLLADTCLNQYTYCKEKGCVSPKDVLQTVCDATAKAAKAAGITVRIILCEIVGCAEWSMELAHMCKDFAAQGVVGIDIAGCGGSDGTEFLPYKEAFEFCKANNIHRTAHAGEKGSAEEVKEALNVLGAERIGHGYHVVNDKKIYTDAKQRRVHFEVCPLSSYFTASVDPDLRKHPAIRFMEDEVSFSINTDDPGVQHTTLEDDYDVARNKFGFSTNQLQMLNLNALRSAFVDEDTKSKLLDVFQAAYNKMNHRQ